MADGKALAEAKKNEKDEFYTQYGDIQNELKHYTEHFEGKTVLCNCNDSYESNFCKFFLRNFKYLKLKRLICTSYAGSPIMPFLVPDPAYGYVMDVEDVPMANGRDITDEDIDKFLHSEAFKIQRLQGNGAFNSPECVAYLKQADIVATFPPVSQFREYVALLMEYDKKFLIIGNVNAITYKDIFSLIMDNKIWLGYHFPDFSATPGNNKHVFGFRWYTNFEISKRHEDLPLYKHYSPEAYPKYDNYDAIEVSKVYETPDDYAGVMGVPITFMDKYNPDQFEIIGLDRYTVPKEFLVGGRVAINGKARYARILIRNKHPKAPQT